MQAQQQTLHVCNPCRATDIQGGSAYGYTLLIVILLANFAAMFLQYLALKLGVVAERDLAQACRDAYPKVLLCVTAQSCSSWQGLLLPMLVLHACMSSLLASMQSTLPACFLLMHACHSIQLPVHACLQGQIQR
jgi:hypothetical protein